MQNLAADAVRTVKVSNNNDNKRFVIIRFGLIMICRYNCVSVNKGKSKEAIYPPPMVKLC